MKEDNDNGDWTSRISTLSINGTLDREGSLSEVTMELDHIEYPESRPDEYRGTFQVTYRFKIEDGTARLGDIQPRDGGRFEPKHLRVAPEAEDVVGNQSGVEEVESVGKTLQRELPDD